MKSKLFSVLALVLICCPAGVAAKENDAPKLKPGEQYRLSIGGIPVDEKKYFNGFYRVDAKGGITIPFAGRIQVGGMPIKEAQTAMEKALKKLDVYRVPEIKLEHTKDDPQPKHR